MTKFYISLIAGLLACSASYSQNTFPASGNVGIGTTTPNYSLDVAGVMSTSSYSQSTLGFYTNLTLNGFNSTLGNGYLAFRSNGVDNRMVIAPDGNVGVGTATPQARLHVLSGSSSANATSQFSGDLIIQGYSGGRSTISGASLEFVIPANTAGDNPWGQGRIITVAGNSQNSDATGKMIIGTRRMFDKGTGSGQTWNYGDDIVIDGSGHVGIGTTDPRDYKLAVAGNIISESVTVKLQSQWPDYVFKPTYKLPSLTTVKTYINKNQHLPDMPSEAEVAKEGINLGEMVKLQIKKIEELTLYLIEKDIKEKEQQKRIETLEKKMNRLMRGHTK